MRVDWQGITMDQMSVIVDPIKPVTEIKTNPVIEKMINDKNKSNVPLDLIKTSAPPNEEELMKATAFVNKAMKMANYHLEFKPYKDSGKYQVKVVDSDTQKVIREIPSEAMMKLSSQLRDMFDKAVGLLVDEIG